MSISVSATNVALVYEQTISNKAITGSSGGDLSGTMILETFFLYALLQDCAEREEPLELPHQVEQAHRLLRSMNGRNERTGKVGLNHWLHRCEGCFKTVKEVGSEEICE